MSTYDTHEYTYDKQTPTDLKFFKNNLYDEISFFEKRKKQKMK